MRAIESLVKKIKEKRGSLDSLLTAVSTNGTQSSGCVTIQRTLDGRMQIAGRKCLPHVIYARIWRWPDLHRNELKHCKFCPYGFDLKQDCVCINPYHYERVVSPVDFSALSLSPLEDHESYGIPGPSDSDSELPDTVAAAESDQPSRLESHLSCSPTLHESVDLVSSSSSALSGYHRSQLISDTLLNERGFPDMSNAPSSFHEEPNGGSLRRFPTSSFSKEATPQSTIAHMSTVSYFDQTKSSLTWSGVVPHHPPSSHESEFASILNRLPSSPLAVITETKKLTNGFVNRVNMSTSLKLTGSPQGSPIPALDHFSSCCVGFGRSLDASGNTPTRASGNTSKHGGGSGPTSSGAAGGGGSSGNSGRSTSSSGFGTGLGGLAGNWNQRSGPPQSQFNPSGSLLQPVPVLTTQRPPEFWCNIAYFELDQQVGELFKVPSQYSRVTVDGYTDPSSPNRFCLGQLSNVHRCEQSEKSRLYIGKGVELDNVGEGDVWIRCLSEFSVFVQSYYLDREAGRRPGDAVHKIYPGAYIKVFDIRQCHEQMKLLAHSAQLAAEHQAAVVVGSLPSPTAGATQIPPQLLSQLPPGPSQSNVLQSSPSSINTGSIPQLATADVGVDDLRRLCMLRLSFVKGWGPDYPRRSIKETPCWIEIQLHRPLQLLDEVLQSMPLNSDRKPTRHFFPYFSQPTSCIPPRPPPTQATTRRT